jgi:hypothetical protein
MTWMFWIYPPCDAIILPMHEHEASPACARSVLIEGRLPNKYISLHALVGCCSCQLSLFNSFPASLATGIPLSPTVSRNGSISVNRHLPNRSKALLQVIDYRGIRPAWAKGLAARMLSTFRYTSHSTHCPWGLRCMLSLLTCD